MDEMRKNDYSGKFPDDPKEAVKILKESGLELTEEEQAQVTGGFLSIKDLLELATGGSHVAEVIKKRFDPFSNKNTTQDSKD